MGGFDAAVEITPEDIRMYVDGVVCEEPNAFAVFVEGYFESLALAYRDITHGSGEIVILTGRWHVETNEAPYFDAVVLHVIDGDGNVRTTRYDLEIFGNDYHQNKTAYVLTGSIDDRTIMNLSSSTKRMAATLSDELTLFCVPLVDGIAWPSDNPHAPPIFCHLDSPAGLDRHALDETLKLKPELEQNALTKPATGPLSLGKLMEATRYPVYLWQMRFSEDGAVSTKTIYYERDTCLWSDLLLSETSDVDGAIFATDWQHEGDGISFRILV